MVAQDGRVQHWIERQAGKRGMRVLYVDPNHFSTTCPHDGTRMRGTGYRASRCPECGYADDRDHIAVKNLHGRDL